jgi:hypothetical protein
MDTYGDGLCSPNFACGSYTITLNEEIRASSDGKFGKIDTVKDICVDETSASPIESPSESPTELLGSARCDADSTDFRYKNKKKKGCRWVRKGKKKKRIKKKCKKMWDGELLSYYCSKSCGEVGLGPCAR